MAYAQTSELVNLVLYRQASFYECVHPFIDKSLVITEPAVPSARPLGLGLKLYPYPSNKQYIRNKNL